MTSKSLPNFEDMIVNQNENKVNKPSIMEQIYYTIDAIFTNKNRLQKTRLSNRNIRGIAKVVAINTFLRRRLGKDYEAVIDPKTGNFTESKYDNKIIAAVTDAVITAKISKDGKSREEIVQVLSAAQTSTIAQTDEHGNPLRRFDY
jgi:hypothetical protein